MTHCGCSQSVHFENAVFDVSESIVQDQSRLFGANTDSEFGGSNNATASQTATLIDTLIDESYALHRLAGSGSTPASSLALLQSKIHSLSDEHQKILAYLVSAELNQRDAENKVNAEPVDSLLSQDAKSVLFQAYTNLNQDLSDVLQSAKQSYKAQTRNSKFSSARTLQTLVWDLRESTIEMELEMGRDIYLSAQSTGLQDSPLAIHNLTTRLDRIDDNINALSGLGSVLVSDHSIQSKVTALAKWHNASYKPTLVRYVDSKANKIHAALGADSSSNQIAMMWAQICQERASHYESLWDETNQHFGSLTTALINKANRNLIIDSLLILLATLMSVWIVKTVRQIKHQAEHDSLTNLPNQRKLRATLLREIAESAVLNHQPDMESDDQVLDADNTKKNEEKLLALIRIDLNKFKLIRETMGNATGDTLLKTVARRLENFSSANVMPASMGGSEFTVIAKCKTKKEGIAIARTMKEQLQEDLNLSGKRFNLDARLGIAFYPEHAGSADALMQAADFAKLQACEPDATCVGVYDQAMADSFQYRLDIESELVEAISENQLTLFYQPQFDLYKNKADRLEALVRWQHPTRGFMSPGEFLTIAENSGLMPMLGDWVLHEVIRQTAVWNTETEHPLAVAVNVSADQLSQDNFVSSVLTYLNRYDLNPEFLEIEITESLFLHNVDKVSETLKTLQSHQIRIALDDFGTGYSSLSQLHSLPVDTLKIDRSFVQLLDDPEQSSHAVTSTIVSMAKHYNLEIVAEGAESIEHVHLLRDMNVDLIQGFYFSKPVSSDQVHSVIASINADPIQPKAA